MRMWLCVVEHPEGDNPGVWGFWGGFSHRVAALSSTALPCWALPSLFLVLLCLGQLGWVP